MAAMDRSVAWRAALLMAADLAVEEINAAGGIKSLGGAKIDPILGDAQSTPDGGNAEVEKMNAAGVSAIVGGFASGICLATTQTAGITSAMASETPAMPTWSGPKRTSSPAPAATTAQAASQNPRRRT